MANKKVKKASVVPPKAKYASIVGGTETVKPERISQLSNQTIVACCFVAFLSFTAGIVGRQYLSPPQQLVPTLSQGHRQNKELVGVKPNYDCSNVNDFLHDENIAGMHVICLHENHSFDLYVGAKQTTMPTNNNLSDQISWESLKVALENTLALTTRPIQHQPWAIFSSGGELLATEMDDSVDINKLAGIVLLMEGGKFLWPGVRPGFQRVIDLSYLPGETFRGPPRNATIETLSLFPLVLSVQGFLDIEECNYIQHKATPSMKYSEVSLMDQDVGRPASDFRTSQSTFLTATNDALLLGIDNRTASLVRIPKTHQEHVQVLRYGYTEKYDAHCDYFDPSMYQNDPGTLETIENGARNRLATVFWYLSDVSQGGETIFPRWNKAPQPFNFKDCTNGLKVKPQRGKVIIFYSMLADGSLDVLSLHAACPVQSKDDIKWAANKWVWSKPVGFAY
jgi:prolyl 4-hydroxylase